MSLSLPDTPYKSANTYTVYRVKPPMTQVKADMEREIKNTLHTIETETFLDKIIPAIPTIDESLRALEQDGEYDGIRWSKFPKEPKPDEKTLYKPLAAISNAIVGTMPQKQIITKIIYVDRHSSPPKSIENEMAAGRPDGAGAHPDDSLTKLEEKVSKLEDSVRTRGDAAKNAKAIKKLRKETKRLLDLYELWWMCIHVVYEIKVTKTEAERYSAVKQLAAYMRQVLTEQLDRRFVLGFVLLLDELTLALYDRSGLTMTSTPINIHQEPKKFIQIITGFSSMNPAQLGWDTAMNIYRPISQDTQASYTIASKFEGIHGTGRYNIHWVIDVEQDGEVEQYVTVAIISAIRSAEICGRATVVYEVVKFVEKEHPRQTYALKRYWRPIRVDDKPDPEPYLSEGEIYARIDRGQADDMLKHAIVYHDIKIGDGVDSTFKVARCGIVAERYKRPVKPLPTKRKETDADAELRVEMHDVPEVAPVPHTDDSEVKLIERHHVNILMPMGQEIKLFRNLLELLLCFRDFIIEHKDVHSKLVLHRDISAGNVLIFQAEDGSTFGRLMDYDHAKVAKNKRPISSEIVDLDEKRRLLQSNLQYEFPREVDINVVDRALKWLNTPSDALRYIKEAATLLAGDDTSKKPVCIADLRWSKIDEIHEWPDFANRTPGDGERTGTLPYMSGDVISKGYLHLPAGSRSAPKFVHEAIHDVESFLWVLVRLCLTRKGPGINMRREELDDQSPLFDFRLRDKVVRLFEGAEEVLKQEKRNIHAQWEHFEEKVIVYFHQYFEPLKPYVRRWWITLILGYRHHGEEFYNIHDHIIRILDEAIKEIRNTATRDDEATQAEINRRKRQKENRLSTFTRQDLVPTPSGSSPLSYCPSSPPLPSSPRSLRNTPSPENLPSRDEPDSPSAAISHRSHARKKLKQ